MSRYTSKADVKAMHEAQGGKCSQCPTALIIGPNGQRVNFIVEHIQALGRGGDNTLGNKDLRCRACAAKKTFHPRSNATTVCSDIFEIAKTDRLVERRTNPPKKKRKWPSRPFPKRIKGATRCQEE